jgi:hypothetical protein
MCCHVISSARFVIGIFIAGQDFDSRVSPIDYPLAVFFCHALSFEQQIAEILVATASP